MLRRAGTYYVIGYGGMIDVPAIDMISQEINFVGNLVGTYNDLDELMPLTAEGRVTLKTRIYPLDGVNDAMNDLEHGKLHGRGIFVPGVSN
jgi:NAD+-dependent secondary alcohol dehydrogenase Adh1